jgi:hypothetical protein
MPEFLAETYTPRGTPGTDTAAARPGDIARAAGQASAPGAPVRFLHAIVVPAEETCFWLYQAPSAGAVRAASPATNQRRKQMPMPATTPPLPMPPAPSDTRCAALFAFALQPSGTPTTDMVAAAIRSAVQRFGPRGCTERMAQGFGDRPDAAARRLRWARRLAA